VVTQRVDAEAIHVIPDDDVLVAADQQVLQVGVFREHLLQGGEIPHRVVSAGLGTSLAVEKPVVLKFARPHVGIW